MNDMVARILGIVLAVIVAIFFILLSPLIYLYRLMRTLKLPRAKDKALLLAIKEGSEEKVREAISAGANTNRRYTSTQIDYMFGIKKSWSLFSVRIIFDDVVNPLIVAITQPTPCLGCIVLLLEHGASPLDRMPLIYAIRADQPEILNVLIRYGAQVNPEESRSWGPLFEAIYENNTPLVTMLLEQGADTNLDNAEVGFPLHFALSFADIDPVIIEELLNHGADATMTNSIGKTTLELAKETGNDTIIAIIEKFVAKK